MGKVFKPEDMAKGRKWIIDESLRDLTPGVREHTKRIFESWKGEESKKRLVRLLGDEEAKQLLEKLKKL